MGSVRSRIWKGERRYFLDFVNSRGERQRVTVPGRGKAALSLARRLLQQKESEAALGLYNVGTAETPYFDAFGRTWLERMAPPRTRPKTHESYEDQVEHLIRAFGHARLGAISKADVERWLTAATLARPVPGQKKPLRSLSIATKNYGLRLLKTVLTSAVDDGVLDENPAAKVRPLPDARMEEPVRFLTPDQVDRLVSVAEQPYSTLWLLLAHTGLRRGEALGARWRDFDAANARLQVRRSLGRVRDGGRYVLREKPLKTAKSRRTVPLSPSLRDALLALPAGDDPEADFIFRSRNGQALDPENLDRAWRRHLLLAGLPLDFRVHDLRHTAATWLLASGENIKTIMALLGHSSPRLLLTTYGHVLPSIADGVGERLDAFLVRQRHGNKNDGNANGSRPIAESRTLTGIAGGDEGI